MWDEVVSYRGIQSFVVLISRQALMHIASGNIAGVGSGLATHVLARCLFTFA
jgi:hypothetical protein